MEPSHMDLSHIPFLKPPPGVVPNFVDPVSQARDVIVINVIWITLMVCFVVMRIYTKGQLLRKLGWDDYTCVLAAMGSICHTAVVLDLLHQGLGIHMWDMPVTKVTQKFVREINALSIIYPVVIFLTKLSILLLYHRIFSSHQIMKYLIWFGIIFQFVFYTFYTTDEIVYEFKCTSANYLSSAYCRSSYILLLLQGSVNVATDFYVLCLPIARVWKLQLPLRRKVGVVGIFLTGLLACVVSVVRLALSAEHIRSADITWTATPTTLMTCVEINTGIIVGCMFTAPLFFQHHRPKSFSLASLRSYGSRLISRIRESSTPRSKGSLPGPHQSIETPHLKDNSRLTLGNMTTTGKLGRWREETDTDGWAVLTNKSMDGELEANSIMRTIDEGINSPHSSHEAS